ncbi:hypothetical protein K432DRAFT_10908 [Lepidopterella palustris CBS 459.81]|uniref:Uncharacterized protein n=1 Tax=Lepidopterella palustris CBS 459.81 TaxID=1314670 RepID=A0A8E2J8G3_9PEZI|nr:hypothetical protein K432DRAFT_10908 [Lepidopterella palustris CBS 459.81]
MACTCLLVFVTNNTNINDDTFLTIKGKKISRVKGPKTNVSDFMAVLAKRGFMLKGFGARDGAREGSNVGVGVGVNLSNRMFVKMFVKAAPVRKGRNIMVNKGPGPGVRGRVGVRVQCRVIASLASLGRKFVSAAEVERESEDEAGVLKPCSGIR